MNVGLSSIYKDPTMDFNRKSENWEFGGTHSFGFWGLTAGLPQACDGCLEVIKQLNSLLKVYWVSHLLDSSSHLIQRCW